jgi:UDP-N-acetylmuramoyl-tripeptide--D-alanyl-D-alanine ligase
LDIALEDIVYATNGRFTGDFKILSEVNSICIDSRKISNGDLFIPIKGENFDGHDFINEAFENGAIAALIQREHEGKIEKKNKHRTLIFVEDTKKALQDIAAFYKKKFDVKVIGITGSVGKSTVKEMAASVFGTEFNVLKTQGNLNGQIGLPLVVLKLKKETQVLVAEMGISQIGEMENLSRIAEPDFAIITNIGISHLEYFKTTEITCREKLKIAKNPNCRLYLNGDSPELSRISCGLPNEIVYFGLNGDFSYKSEKICASGESTDFVLIFDNFKENIKIPCLGIHNVYNALAVISLALDVGIYLDDIKNGLENFSPLPQRGQIIHINDIILLNDSYNSSPDSVKASVSLLQFVRSEGKTIAIMADMLELGVRSKEIHFEIGKYLALSGIDIVITIGNTAEFISKGAKAAKSNTITFECDSNAQAAEILLKNISKGDKVLVKGSRGMKTEEVIDLFLLGL